MPRSRAAAPYDRRSSVINRAGTKPHFFNSLRMSFSAACLSRLAWTSTSRISLCVPKIGFGVDAGNKRSKLLSLMTDLFRLILGILASPVKTRAELEAENLVLRQ